FQAEDGIRDFHVTGVQTCALPIFSFACPGLLGSKRYFKQHFSDPIDKFKDKKRARELQQKISPFILRRTKEQVAKELPNKTEMRSEERRVGKECRDRRWRSK